MCVVCVLCVLCVCCVRCVICVCCVCCVFWLSGVCLACVSSGSQVVVVCCVKKKCSVIVGCAGVGFFPGSPHRGASVIVRGFTVTPTQRMGFHPYGRLVVNAQYWKRLVGLSLVGIPKEVCSITWRKGGLACGYNCTPLQGINYSNSLVLGYGHIW